ncbi:MAG: hypothetical protein WCB67_13385 [Solirubrobacteraceae bacterium]
MALARDDAIAVEVETAVRPLLEQIKASTPVASLKRRRRVLQARREAPGLEALPMIGVIALGWTGMDRDGPGWTGMDQFSR